MNYDLYVSPVQKNWAKFLQMCVFHYNVAPNKTTNMSPYSLVFCKEPRLYPDVFLYDSKNYDLDTTFKAISKLREQARIRIMETGAKYAEYYDKMRREGKYEIGDLVLLYKPERKVGQAQKLMINWVGPYKIIGRQSDLNYEIEAIDCDQTKSIRTKREIVHIERLRKYVTPNQQSKPHKIFNTNFVEYFSNNSSM